MPTIVSTVGLLNFEFVIFLFWKTHRETDPLFSTSGVQIPQSEFRLRNPTLSHVPLPSRGVLITTQVESGTHPCQDYNPS